MKLKSSAFSDGEFIPRKYTCDDRDINPPLEWSEVPNGTKSFMLIVDDPDAPVGTWTHWIVCNISKDTNIISEDMVPLNATQIKNSFRKQDYGGPCPPSGIHRYFFKLYALDIDKLDNVTLNNAENLAKKYEIKMSQIMGKYKRK